MNYGALVKARITEDLLEKVKQEAERQNCNVSEIVRLALLAYVEKRGQDDKRHRNDET